MYSYRGIVVGILALLDAVVYSWSILLMCTTIWLFVVKDTLHRTEDCTIGFVVQDGSLSDEVLCQIICCMGLVSLNYGALSDYFYRLGCNGL